MLQRAAQTVTRAIADQDHLVVVHRHPIPQALPEAEVRVVILQAEVVAHRAGRLFLALAAADLRDPAVGEVVVDVRPVVGPVLLVREVVADNTGS